MSTFLTKSLMEELHFADPVKLQQVSVVSSFHQGLGRKGPCPSYERQTSLSPGITRQCWLTEHNTLLGSLVRRWSQRYADPWPYRTLKVSTDTLKQIWYTTEKSPRLVTVLIQMPGKTLCLTYLAEHLHVLQGTDIIGQRVLPGRSQGRKSPHPG